VVSAYDLRDKAQRLFDDADALLHDACHIGRFEESDIEYLADGLPRVFATASPELRGRFDASHHVPVARSAVHKLGRGSFDLVRLHDTTARVVRPDRFKRVYVDASQHGVPFFQPSYVPLFRPQQHKFISRVANADVLEECMLKANTILVTRSGTAAKCCLVTNAFEGWAGSDDLLRVTPGDDWDPGFLTAFLMTPYARHQVLAEVYGGVIDHVDEGHVSGVYCPQADFDVQRAVGDLIRQAYAARDRANETEEEAFRLLDDAVGYTGVMD
jgi:type I restriction enzyme S subunit